MLEAPYFDVNKTLKLNKTFPKLLFLVVYFFKKYFWSLVLASPCMPQLMQVSKLCILSLSFAILVFTLMGAASPVSKCRVTLPWPLWLTQVRTKFNQCFFFHFLWSAKVAILHFIEALWISTFIHILDRKYHITK